MNKRKIARSNPWQRGPKKRSNPLDDIKNTRNYVSEQRVMGYVKIMEKYGSKERRFQTIFQNKYLDIFTKRVVLKASAAVVSIVSYCDEREIFHGSGTIIESDGRSGIILTSASMNGCPTDKNVGMDNVKVVVYLSDVIALGRYFIEPYEIMAAPGEFSVNQCDDYDCQELFRAECKITRCGFGGPLINRLGEVIGVTFYEDLFTPFMPINVACKWWEHCKKNQEPRRLWHGMEVANLYVADLRILEKITQKFPNIFKGVLVEEVMRGSPADSAGILPDDVIIRCGGKAVQSFLEFFEIMWDNAGCPVELVAIRASADNPLYLTMVAVERSRDKFYRWPHWGFECKCEDGH